MSSIRNESITVLNEPAAVSSPAREQSCSITARPGITANHLSSSITPPPTPVDLADSWPLGEIEHYDHAELQQILNKNLSDILLVLSERSILLSIHQTILLDKYLISSEEDRHSAHQNADVLLNANNQDEIFSLKAAIEINALLGYIMKIDSKILSLPKPVLPKDTSFSNPSTALNLIKVMTAWRNVLSVEFPLVGRALEGAVYPPPLSIMPAVARSVGPIDEAPLEAKAPAESNMVPEEGIGNLNLASANDLQADAVIEVFHSNAPVENPLQPPRLKHYGPIEQATADADFLSLPLSFPPADAKAAEDGSDEKMPLKFCSDRSANASPENTFFDPSVASSQQEEAASLSEALNSILEAISLNLMRADNPNNAAIKAMRVIIRENPSDDLRCLQKLAMVAIDHQSESITRGYFFACCQKKAESAYLKTFFKIVAEMNTPEISPSMAIALSNRLRELECSQSSTTRKIFVRAAPRRQNNG
ncbi:MAG: hypothetical protein P4M14_00465 [Gammaproteobacteria bacterium]|nr:hypothetical protein [Gammaproteobacteria bacterium]